jgi:hypothetical protein
MTFEWMLLAVVAASAVTVLLVLAGFWVAVVRPYLDKKVNEVVRLPIKSNPPSKEGFAKALKRLCWNSRKPP